MDDLARGEIDVAIRIDGHGDVLLPMRRLSELAQEGVVGRTAPTHYSFMGYILDTTELEQKTAPAIAAAMHEEHVDAVVLVPV